MLSMMKRLGVTPSIRKTMQDNENLVMSLTKLSVPVLSEDVQGTARNVMMLLLMSTNRTGAVCQDI